MSDAVALALDPPDGLVAGEDGSLVFSSANGNLVSINDVDAGAASVRVTLTVTNGVLTLSGTTGLSFSTGDGTLELLADEVAYVKRAVCSHTPPS